jgi:hypothetical protein
MITNSELHISTSCPNLFCITRFHPVSAIISKIASQSCSPRQMTR